MMLAKFWKEGEHRLLAEDYRKGMCFTGNDDESKEELCKTGMYVSMEEPANLVNCTIDVSK